MKAPRAKISEEERYIRTTEGSDVEQKQPSKERTCPKTTHRKWESDGHNLDQGQPVRKRRLLKMTPSNWTGEGYDVEARGILNTRLVNWASRDAKHKKYTNNSWASERRISEQSQTSTTRLSLAVGRAKATMSTHESQIKKRLILTTGRGTWTPEGRIVEQIRAAKKHSLFGHYQHVCSAAMRRRRRRTASGLEHKPRLHEGGPALTGLRRRRRELLQQAGSAPDDFQGALGEQLGGRWTTPRPDRRALQNFGPLKASAESLLHACWSVVFSKRPHLPQRSDHAFEGTTTASISPRF